MSNDHLATYLNDHLSGAVVALELLEHLEAEYANTPIAEFFSSIKAEIAADRQELESLMSHLDITQSKTRKASAWFAEKFTQLKLRLDDPRGGELRLYESLEALSLGIEGKKSLWLALSRVAEETPALRVVDYERLLQRAEEQRRQAEAMRLDTAKAVLSFTPESAET